MKKYVMNKNVIHSGKAYSAGQEIRESDAGFKELVQAGHANVMNFADEGQAPAPMVEASPEMAEEKPMSKKGKK